jgi:molybdate transport system substrate-binding protein
VRRPLAASLALLAVGVLAGCTQQAHAGGSDVASASPGSVLTVDAAASLAPALPKLVTGFEAAHPGTAVRLSYGGSSDLAAAIVAGAPADVFVAASVKTMATVTGAHLAAAPPVAIARNKLEIVVPKGNPGHVTGLKDFGDPARTIVICAPAVPCGATARQVFALAHVTPKPDSLEQSVTGVLTKVRLGDADAGLVYVTDVRAAHGEVLAIPVPEAEEAITDVLIAPLAQGGNPELGRAFAAYVEQHGRNVLDAAGFLAPPR